jgi:hypothetical protein
MRFNSAEQDVQQPYAATTITKQSKECDSSTREIYAMLTTAFTGLRPAEARKTENPPAATPVQRFVITHFGVCVQLAHFVQSRRSIVNQDTSTTSSAAIHYWER